MVAYMEKSIEHADFKEIVDFLNASPIKYALTESPTIYVSYIEQFWSTAKIKIVINERQIRTKVDGKTIVISKSSVRRDLQFNDDDDETAYEERGDSMERATTTTASLDAKQNNGNIIRTQSMTTLNEPIPQDLEITSLKKRVKKLEKKKKCKKSTTQVEVIQKDAENQGRYYHDIDVTTVSAPITTTGVSVSTDEPSNPLTTTIIEDEDLTNSQTLMKMRCEKYKEKEKERGSKEKSSKPTTRPTRGVTMQEPSESGTRKAVPPSQHDLKDNGKAKMIKPEKPLKKKDQIKFDEEVAKRLAEELEAELGEEEYNYELAQRLQAEEQGELTIEERSKLFVELMNKRKKHFAKLRAENIRRKPPTKA
ncbi:hypothetical protein Tco_0849723 [Tanacetum coccineum]